MYKRGKEGGKKDVLAFDGIVGCGACIFIWFLRLAWFIRPRDEADVL